MSEILPSEILPMFRQDCQSPREQKLWETLESVLNSRTKLEADLVTSQRRVEELDEEVGKWMDRWRKAEARCIDYHACLGTET